MSIDVIIQNQGLAISAFFLVSAILTGIAYLLRRRGYEPDLTIDILALVPAVFGVWGLFNELAVTRNLNHNFEVVSERFKIRTDYELTTAKLKIVETEFAFAKETLAMCSDPSSWGVDNTMWDRLCPPLRAYLRIGSDHEPVNFESAMFYSSIKRNIRDLEGISFVKYIADLHAGLPKLVRALFGVKNESQIKFANEEFTFEEISNLLEVADHTQKELIQLREIREIEDEDPLFLILILLAISLEISKTVSRAIYDRRAG